MAEIVGIVAGLVAPALDLGKCFKKQFKYLFCLKTNVQDLTDAAAKMEDKRVDLQNRVDAAKRNDEVISREVETWLTKAEETQRTAQHIIEAEIPAGILSLKPRYSLSRKAMKKTQSMKELLGQSSNFNPLSTPRTFDPPAPLKGTMIDSRKETEENIIMAIKDAGVSVIGLWGMGGVGKTTMAKRIMARAGEEGLFDEFPFVTVSQQADMLRIQRGIADWLGLELNQEAIEPRAHRLRARLTDAKRKLIVIDDVWERIHLENLGIPCDSGSCTVLLTSRHMSAFDVADNKRVFTVETLSEGEAWLLFKENAGACVEDLNLLPIASDVAKECKGLPLALVTVARSLKGNESKGIWLHALKQLRSSNPVDIEDVISKVYNPIKLSIDFLDSPQAKSLLFLCSSFPEDHDIRLECLMFYSVGLCIIDEISNLEEARNRIATLISTLKSRSLILDGKEEHLVKMHDVVRDVAIFIASKEKQAIIEISSSNEWSRENRHSDCTIMLSVVVELPPMELAATFPNLRFLSMPNGGRHSMSVNFLKGMQQLKVMHINRFSFGSMQFPKNLHTLHLEYCNDLETLSPVGELSSLEILICIACRGIKELPVEIGRLNRLRLLDVTGCRHLKTIKSGIISRLGRLEELKMLDSFTGWESVEKGNNVSVVELESLSNLRCLEIEIDDWSLAAQELQLLSSKIVKYDIRVGKRSHLELPIVHFLPNYEKKLYLRFPEGETLSLLSIGKWIDVFARSADYLYLEGHGASNTFDLALGCQNKRRLGLVDCPTVKKLGVFPVLESLHLIWLPNLVEMCYGSNNSFAKLTHIWISGCSKLRSLLTSSLELLRSLSQQLERLVISECGSMEEVFSIELLQEDIVSPITFTFPKLEYLDLYDLPSLTTLCKGSIIHDDMMINMNIQFPRLLQLRIVDCPKLVTSCINIDSDQNHHLNCSSSSSSTHNQDSHLLPNFIENLGVFPVLEKLYLKGLPNLVEMCHRQTPKGSNNSFAKLDEIKILGCGKLRSAFTSSWEAIRSLSQQLEWLDISDCESMEEVFSIELLQDKSAACITFPKLKRLSLYNLKSLTTLCKGSIILDDMNIQFPHLVDLRIDNCPKLINIYSDQNQLLNSSSFSTAHIQDSIPLLCHQKVKFGSLKTLHIGGGYENIICLCCHHIPHPFFGGLEQLYISNCANINNLFSYSIAANLGNLRSLWILRCNEMVYVIADDKAETTEPLTLIFHKLEVVKLVELPKLQSFCEGNWELLFPSLREVEIEKCPDMKGFSLGSISTPNLKEFKVDEQEKSVEDFIEHPWQQDIVPQIPVQAQLLDLLRG